MKISVYVDKRKQNKDNSYAVKIRFKPRNRSAFLLATGIKCYYEPIGYKFPKNEPNAGAKSVQLMKMVAECEEYIYHNQNAPLKIIKANMAEILQGKPVDTTSIFYMFDKYVSGMYEGTKAIYERTKKKILEFDYKADFADIDKKWLERFEQHLRVEGANTNGISIHMRNLRAIFNFAIDEDVTTNYPFRKYRIKQEQTKKRDLTIEQLRQIKDAKTEDWLRKHRDMFMLIFYLCGINIGDLMALTKENVKNGRIEYYRRKTNKYYSIKIEPEADVILKRYKGKQHLISIADTYGDYHDYMRRMNRAIRKIEHDGEPICPTLSTYYARHSWASIAAEVDVPMDVIAQALGHSTPYTTTDIYVNRRLKKVDEANRKVIDYLNGVQ